jgi:predicted translin family RNA/ssDNA-binding protein
MTLDEALELRNFILEKTDRVHHLERMIDEIHAQYKTMTRKQLEEAARDVAGMKREIEEHKKWCAKAKAKVNAYFASPIMVA